MNYNNDEYKIKKPLTTLQNAINKNVLVRLKNDIEYINNLMDNLSRNQLILLIVVLVISIAIALYYLYKCIR